MKLNKLFSGLMIFFAGSVACMSCKKNSTEATVVPDCKISIITVTSAGSTSVDTLTYNTDGTTHSLTTGNDVTLFSYSGNTSVLTETLGGVFVSKRTITTNAAGLTTNRHTETNVSGSAWYNEAFEYNGNETSKDTYTSSSSPASTVSTFGWSGGNMISITSGTTVSTLTYDLNKLSATGDYLKLVQLLQGINIYPSKNVLTSIGLPGATANNFAYDYDASGKIIKINISGTSNLSYAYQYSCK